MRCGESASNGPRLLVAGGATLGFGSIARAIFGYFFLVLIVRIVGRRPGKQITPFEFVLVFYLGGLMLTGVVGPEGSLTNAFCQILAIAAGHFFLVWVRAKSQWTAKVLDGTPLLLMEGKYWRSRTMRKMRVSQADVLAVARNQGIGIPSEIHTAVLERNGEISIIPAKGE